MAAASTVLVTADSTASARAMSAHVRSLDLSTVPHIVSTLVTIETVYDGEDLDAVAAFTGLSREAVIATHAGQTWTAAFGGFAPGFAYMVGETGGLEVPRRPSPRTVVPAGSVALAGIYSAVYPRQSPGGWQLIGRTSATMWDLGRERPALVRPGDRVRFEPVRDVAVAAGEGSGASEASGIKDVRHDGISGLLVVEPGLQSTLQDLGRPGVAHLGVVSSGALDRGALRRANRLVGNPAGTASIESLNGGLVVTACADQVVAVTGADVPLAVSGPSSRTRSVPTGTPFALLARETLAIGAPRSGLRSYLAVRGGFDVPDILGSRSSDTMSGIGPEPVRSGRFLPVAEAPVGSVVGVPETATDTDDRIVELRVVPGPRQDWFSAQTLEDFFRQEWTATSKSSRIGLRLDGRPLTRQMSGELATEGTVSGAIQVPPEGLPVLLLADHPVTIGYPVIGVVVTADLDRAAQLAPGSPVRFVRALDASPVTSSISKDE